MNSNQMVSLLKTLLEDELAEKSRVQIYIEAGLLTRDEGLEFGKEDE